MIELANPRRGAMLQFGGYDPASITVNGTACDSVNTVTSLTLDGQAVPLTGSAPCFAFTSDVTSHWGLNVITGSAQNDVGATAKLAQAHIRSPEYFGTSGKSAIGAGAKAASESVPIGLRMELNQELVDDGSRALPPDDMVTLLQAVLNKIDLGSYFPTTLVAYPDANEDGQVDSHTCSCVFPLPDITVHSTGYRVTRGALLAGPLLVNYARLSSNGLSFDMSLSPINMPVTVTGYLDPTCSVACVTHNLTTASSSGTLGADSIHITVTADPYVASNGLLQVSICQSCLTVDVINPYLDIDFGALDFLDGPLGLSNIATAILQSYQNEIESLFQDQVRGTLASFLLDFIDSLRPKGTVTLPPPMNTELTLGSTFDRMEFGGTYPNGFISTDLSVSVTPANPVMENGYGSIRRDGTSPTFSPTGYALGVGLKDDLLNQFLWAAWSGGALELDQLSASGCTAADGSRVSMSAKLPPVVMPGTNGHQIDIGLGDLYLVATPALQMATSKRVPVTTNVSLYASAIIGATVSFDTASSKLVLTPAENPQIDVQIVSAPEGADLDALGAQYGDLLQCALPKLLSDIVGAVPGFSIPIGKLDVPGVPSDSEWVFADDAAFARPDSSFAITGSVAVK